MSFTADLHIHSRFSRATSRSLSTHTLSAWAMVKGINVLGTGDFTHPAWREELRQSLTMDEESGLYRMKDSVSPALALPAWQEQGPAPAAPRFLLQAEVSSIYKRHGKVRKVHNLVFMPHLDSAEKLCRTLEGIGNLASDGRPILGLDSRNLLEIVLETDPLGVVIPAHIWTPWFAIFGSKSGFDSMEECFGDLTEHIFALETGLSSDPAMNRLWSHLDRYSLISNSDAHSGGNLAREVNVFSGSPSYADIFAALDKRRTNESLACRFEGTVEFFPEEGKYHLDGHRACGVVLEPEESRKLGNLCPVCGKPLTVGVLHRVLELADRQHVPDHAAESFNSLVPLPELLGELLQVGAQSRKVEARYTELVRRFGSELAILDAVPLDALRRHWEGLGEGIARMRQGRVLRQGGYDGEYGTVRVFTPQEAASFRTGSLHALPGFALPPRREAEKNFSIVPADPPASTVPPDSTIPAAPLALPGTASPLPQSSPKEPQPTDKSAHTKEQAMALAAGPGPVIVMAGPGTGKTHTLLGRMARLLEQGHPAESIMTVTFTRRAAEELRQRLARLFPAAAKSLRCDTLHAMAWQVLLRPCIPSDTQGALQPPPLPPLLLHEEASRTLFATALADLGLPGKAAQAHWEALGLAREQCCLPKSLAPAQRAYAAAKAHIRAVDYTDLLELWLEKLQAGMQPQLPHHVLVDEIQDLSPLQWAVVHQLLPKDGQGFFGIGDADQAIYGFRGAQADVRSYARALWPTLMEYKLTLSHRATQDILDCAESLLHGPAPETRGQRLRSVRTDHGTIRLFHAPDAQEEARWIARHAAALLGGTSHTMTDAAHVDCPLLAPGDMAVLVRLKAQIPPLRKALEQAGVPCAVPEEEGCWHEPRVELLLRLAAAQEGHPLQSMEEAPELAIPTALWRQSPSGLQKYLGETPPFDALFWQSRAWKSLVRLWQEEKSWHAVLGRIALLRDVEEARSKAERVQIMTLHAAKGLEFRAVFLPGLEEGLLPLKRELLWAGEGTEKDLAQPLRAREKQNEERRLCYVGITRAAEMVFFSHTGERQWQGRTLRLAPSPYCLALRSHCHTTALRAHKAKKQQLSLW